MGRTREALLTRCEIRNAAGVKVSEYFSMPIVRGGRSTSTTLQAAHVPAFEGRAAWFEVERVAAQKPYWRALRRLDRPVPRQLSVAFG